MDKIFIQIASYRDPQCGPTIQDLINKAQQPERLSFGVCLQWNADDSEETRTCGPDSLPECATLRLTAIHSSESQGTCWARAQCQSLWRNEDFTLQIDSHMRAEPDWDALLITYWQQLQNRKGILSCYPNAFTVNEADNTIHYSRDLLPLMAAKEFGGDGLLRLRGISKFPIPDGLPKTPPKGAFISAGMLFAPASIIADIPYDPHLYFYGEESTYAARLWTAGYDLYNPHRPLLYHLYKTAGEGATHWSDHTNWSELNRTSVERALTLLNQSADLGPYGLGSERSMADYQDWSGINFTEQTIQQHALDGIFGAAKA